MEKLIFGIAGQKQSGKTTMSNYIHSLTKDSFYEYSFADNLKQFCMNTLGLTRKQCGYDNGTDDDKNLLTEHNWETVDEFFRRKYGNVIKLDDLQGPTVELKKGLMTAREVMQVQGEMQRRMFSKDIWVKSVIRQINNNPSGVHVVSDVRYQNEIEAVLNSGGYIIYLSKITNHDKADSETELLNINWNSYKNIYEINNTHMTIEEKNATIRQFLLSNEEMKKFFQDQ